MTRVTSILQDGILVYQHNDVSCTLVVGTPAWSAWLVNATSFIFVHEHGNFTARKERAGNRRGNWYWRAYRKYHGTLARAYIGKAEELTLTRLNEIAQTFSHAKNSADQTKNIPARKQTDSSLEATTIHTRQHLPDSSSYLLPYGALLRTKLSIPLVSAQVLPRPRLYQQLQQVNRHQLTLISAAAGFGKTTLLSAWYTASRREFTATPMPFAWLSLDEGDNTSTRFWTHLIAALAMLQRGIGADALALFSSTRPPPIETILTILINDITTILDDFVLVLDDYQHITVQSIHSAVQFLLDHLPAHMHLVIASRTEPPLSLARLRARGQLLELSTTDLRFTFEETTAFLDEVLQLHLPTQDLATLDTRIEGWIAGLQLAALSLRGQADISGFVAEFTGSHHYIIDYLIEEVLHRQTEQVQRFLLQTSIVERLDASLCNALIPTVDGQSMLTLLDQANLFIVPLDHARKWYRYHALFADVLRTRLHHLHPHWIPNLHLKASGWYANHGFLVEAIEHALAAPDFELAASLIEQSAQTTPTIWVAREYSLLQRWLAMLPPAFLRSHVQLGILHAWVLFSSMQQDTTIGLEVVETHLHAAKCSLDLNSENSQTPIMRGEIAAISATTSFIKGDTTQATTCALLALELLPHYHTTLRGVAARTLVNAYSLSGNTEAASRALGELMSICQATNDIYTTLNAFCNLAQLQTLQGHLHGAAATYQRAIQLPTQKLQQIILGWPYIGLSSILLEWNRMDEANDFLLKGLAQCQKDADPGILLAGYDVLARLKQIQGNSDEAFQALEKSEFVIHKYRSLANSILVNSYMPAVEAQRAYLYLLQGNVEAAICWAQTCKPVENEQILPRLKELSILTRVYLATQQFAKASQLLAQLVKAVEQVQQIENLIAILSLQALAFSIQGDSAQAISTLAKALSLAQRGEYIRIFVDEGRPMAVLLAKLLEAQHKGRPPITKSLQQRYIRQLLAAMPLIALEQPSSLLVPLSEREIEVLRLMAAGLPDREIAQQLVLAIGTIKTHAKRIYAKLNVNNRTQAVLRAQILHLL